jgi:hypothetical protein
MPMTAPALDSVFVDLETRLFAWDAEASTARANAFVRGAVRGATVRRRPRLELVAMVPEYPGAYARGGETTVIRANDAALALARRARAA